MMIIETVVNILVAVEEYNVHKDYAIMDWVISPYYGLLIHLWVVTKLYNSQVVRDLWSSQWDKEMVGMGLRQGPRGVVGELMKVRTSLVYFKYLSPEKNYQKGPLTIKKII